MKTTDDFSFSLSPLRARYWALFVRSLFVGGALFIYLAVCLSSCVVLCKVGR